MSSMLGRGNVPPNTDSFETVFNLTVGLDEGEYGNATLTSVKSAWWAIENVCGGQTRINPTHDKRSLQRYGSLAEDSLYHCRLRE